MNRIHARAFEFLSFIFLKRFYQMKQFLMQAYSQLALLCTFFYNTKHCDIKAGWWLFVSLTAGIGMDTLLSSYVRQYNAHYRQNVLAPRRYLRKFGCRDVSRERSLTTRIEERWLYSQARLFHLCSNTWIRRL